MAGKYRFLQLERFRIKAPRFSNRLDYARHYRLGPMSGCCCFGSICEIRVTPVGGCADS